MGQLGSTVRAGPCIAPFHPASDSTACGATAFTPWRDGLEIRWFNAGGGLQQSEQWDEGSTLGLAISRPDLEQEEGIWHDVLMLFNPFEGDVPFQIPQFGEGGWVLELSTAEEKTDGVIITETIDFILAGRSIALFRRP